MHMPVVRIIWQLTGFIVNRISRRMVRDVLSVGNARMAAGCGHLKYTG